jgi:hypothetical protein
LSILASSNPAVPASRHRGLALATMLQNRLPARLGEGGRSWTMTTASSSVVDVEEASWARWLFASKPAAWIGLVARVWLGYE